MTLVELWGKMRIKMAKNASGLEVMFRARRFLFKLSGALAWKHSVAGDFIASG
ncbi:hypothetical protein OS11_48470 [Dickeya oryzae]